jgi:hypothetical protein
MHSDTTCELRCGCSYNDSRYVRLSHFDLSLLTAHMTVYALYSGNRCIAIILSFLLIIEVVVIVCCIIFTFATVEFDAQCIPTKGSPLYLPLAYVER